MFLYPFIQQAVGGLDAILARKPDKSNTYLKNYKGCYPVLLKAEAFAAIPVAKQIHSLSGIKVPVISTRLYLSLKIRFPE